MNLQKQFEIKNYHSLLLNETAKKYNLEIDFFLDEEQKKPEELYDIYISDAGDEIFLTLNGDEKDLKELCRRWDDKLSRFVIFGSDDRKVLRKFKYNIVQLILCQKDIADHEEEGSLNVSRKIILPCAVDIEGNIEIPDEEAVEIPFYMITSGNFSLDQQKQDQLKRCLPLDELAFLKKERTKGRGKKATFEDSEYSGIEEWLKNVYQECEG